MDCDEPAANCCDHAKVTALLQYNTLRQPLREWQTGGRSWAFLRSDRMIHPHTKMLLARRIHIKGLSALTGGATGPDLRNMGTNMGTRRHPKAKDNGITASMTRS